MSKLIILIIRAYQIIISPFKETVVDSIQAAQTIALKPFNNMVLYAVFGME